MPIYDYQCVKCKETQEEFLSMKDAKKKINKKCKFCENTELEKKISGTIAINFVGSGFYVNDYGKKNNNKN